MMCGISMAWQKTVVTPVHQHRSYHSLVLSHYAKPSTAFTKIRRHSGFGQHAMASVGPQLIPLWCWDFSPKWPVFTSEISWRLHRYSIAGRFSILAIKLYKYKSMLPSLLMHWRYHSLALNLQATYNTLVSPMHHQWRHHSLVLSPQDYVGSLGHV